MERKQTEAKIKKVEPSNHSLIVNYHNDLADLSLQSLSAREQNALMYLLAALKDKKEIGDFSTEIVVPISEIKKQAGIKSKDKRQIEKQLKQMNKKLMGIQGDFHPDPDKPLTSIQFVLFPTFTTSLEDDTLSVMVNPRFEYLINYLTGNYTKFELEEFVGLTSKYSKLCYRQIKRYRDTGRWIVTIDDFKRHLGIGDSYSDNKELTRRVLKPVEKELSECIEGLKIETVKDKTQKGHPITSIKFTFKPDKSRGKRFSREQLPKDAVIIESTCEEVSQKEFGYTADCHDDEW